MKQTRTYLFVSLCLILLISCNDQRQGSENVIRLDNKSIKKSIAFVKEDNARLYNSIKIKSNDPKLEDRCSVFGPKAMSVQLISSENITYLENLKSAKDIDWQEVVKRMEEHTAKLSNIDQEFKRMLSSDSNALQILPDTIKSNSYYLGNLSQMAKEAMLNNAELNIFLLEQQLVKYCDENISPLYLDETAIAPLLTQNIKRLRAGDTLEIMAGISTFQRANLTVTIDGKRLLVSNGAAIYNERVQEQPGNYSKAVDISFYDENGKVQTYRDHVNFTVDP